MLQKVKAARKRLTWKVRDGLYNLKLRQLRPDHAQQNLILVYHGVVPDARTDINARFISSSMFEQQLAWFSQHFEVVELAKLFEESGTIPASSGSQKPRISLTFDDGYLNNLEVVLPLLERYKLPATFFLTPILSMPPELSTCSPPAAYDFLWADALDLFKLKGPSNLEFAGMEFRKVKNEYRTIKGLSLKDHLRSAPWAEKEAFLRQWPLNRSTRNPNDSMANSNGKDFRKEPTLAPYWQLIPPTAIAALAQHPLLTIGCHGLMHNNLGSLPLEDAKKELSESKRILEAHSHQEITALAWPDDSYSEALKDYAEELGFREICTSLYRLPGDTEDPRILPRLGINPYISLNNQLEAIIKGKY